MRCSTKRDTLGPWSLSPTHSCIMNSVMARKEQMMECLRRNDVTPDFDHRQTGGDGSESNRCRAKTGSSPCTRTLSNNNNTKQIAAILFHRLSNDVFSICTPAIDSKVHSIPMSANPRVTSTVLILLMCIAKRRVRTFPLLISW
jgi:hypothetical protein